MKIEKIDNNKIRCYLDGDDLSSRQIDLKELAYGTEKARKLFHEMLEEASEEFGFEFDDTPIMIEAIPLSSDSIILIISKVDDPDELDTRFSRFAPGADDADLSETFSSLLPKLLEGLEDLKDDADTEQDDVHDDIQDAALPEAEKDYVRIFCFNNIDEISDAAQSIAFSEGAKSSVYFDSEINTYYLVTSIGSMPKDDYTRLCNTLSEFGRQIRGNIATAAYYEEHLEAIIKENAIDICRSL
ncbi:MAG: adaptor protein MecA [Lachnospiraceae bacterium]|nr:adaptor protein MecA [Lachnospiraceae bacterium]